MEDKSHGRKLPLPSDWHTVHSERGPRYWDQGSNVTQWNHPPTDEGKRKLA